MFASSHLRALQPARALLSEFRRRRTVVPWILGGLFAVALGAAPASADDLPGAFSGNAFATFANVKAGPIAASLGRSAFQGCPCNGTGGQTLTDEIDNVSAGDGGVLTANVTQSTAFTQKTATSAEVQNTSTITGLNVLGGVVTADAIKAVATISAATKTITPSSDGSALTNLVIAGQSIPANVPPNTTIALPGIGSVTLYKVATRGAMKKSGAITVDMITINVSVRNGLGLPVGAAIVVGHAQAGFARVQPVSVFGGQAYAAPEMTAWATCSKTRSADPRS